MSQIGQYIISLVAAAIICSCMTAMLPKKGPAGGILRFLCGLFMTLTLFAPIVEYRLPDFDTFFSKYSYDAEESFADAQKVSEQIKTEYITERISSYILDKADSLGISVSVDISLNDTLLPEMVIIKGAASPFAKSKLSDYVSENLGIPEDKLQWT